ncbi:MAG: HEAT repeat domain-containing protein [Verrucomicrobiota bacterium]
MNKLSIFAAACMLATIACSESPKPDAAPTPAEETQSSTNALPPAATNAPAGPTSISIQEMLVIGHSGLKLHSLAMITQGKAKDGVDESFLPGFKVCSEDSATPVRSVTARLLGQHFVEGKEAPNPEAVALLVKLAQDESSDVSYSAVYHGLTQIQNKSSEIVALLIDVASANREQGLYERIAQSLESNREQVVQILDEKLAEGADIATYEIYEDLAGKEPAGADKYLDMPSSRPKMFIFKGEGDNAEAFRSELETELVSAGLENPDLSISGVGENYVLMLKTYITKDRIAVEKAFTDHDKYTLTQKMWLTPELEIQIEAMRKAPE